MKIIHLIDEYLEAGLAAFLLAVIVTLITIQVFMRYVMQNSLSWSEELTLWLFVWFIWLATSYAFKRRAHVRVAVLDQVFSPRGQLILNIFNQLLIVCFLAILVYQCFILMNMPFVAKQRSVVLGMPIQYFYASAPLGAALSLVRLVQNLGSDIKALKTLTLDKSVNV